MTDFTHTDSNGVRRSIADDMRELDGVMTRYIIGAKLCSHGYDQYGNPDNVKTLEWSTENLLTDRLATLTGIVNETWEEFIQKKHQSLTGVSLYVKAEIDGRLSTLFVAQQGFRKKPREY